MSKQRQSAQRATGKRKDGSDHRHDWATLDSAQKRLYRCSICKLTAYHTSQHPVYWKLGDAGRNGKTA